MNYQTLLRFHPPHNATQRNLRFANSGQETIPFQHAFILFICLLLGLMFNIPVYAKSTRLALVIGNANYQNFDKLFTSINDAKQIANKLQALQFDVMYYSDLNHRRMDEVINDFSEKANAYDVVLFYYAGHGLQAENENFLIPVDLELKTLKQLKYDAVIAQKVLDMMSDSPNKTNLFILDTCRDKPLSLRGLGRGLTRGLAAMDSHASAASTLIVFSTSPGSQAYDSVENNPNSPFTGSLLKYLDKPGLKVMDMLMEVRKDVLAATENKQKTWDSSSMLGAFCFAGCENPEAKLQSTQLNAENARLIAQMAEMKRSYEEQLIANQERLQKLAHVEQQKITLERQINTDTNSKAMQQNLQQKLQAVTDEKHQLEAKVASATHNDADNARLMAQLTELKNQYEQEKSANLERLQKLELITQQKTSLEKRLDSENSTKAGQQSVHQQLQAVTAEKQQLEAKIAITAESNAKNQQTLAEMERYKAEVEHLKQLASVQAESTSREMTAPQNLTNPYQIGGL
ncbi:MAG: caspase family protein [Methylococcales bacterium]